MDDQTFSSMVNRSVARRRWQVQTELRVALETCDQIIESGFLQPGVGPAIVFEATFAYVLACLADALQKLDRANARIDFRDDVDLEDEAKDVTDLVQFCRNAACHVNSGSRIVAKAYFTPTVLIGHRPNYLQIGDRVIGCDYEDDVAVLFGSTRIYLHRHVIRAFREAREKLATI